MLVFSLDEQGDFEYLTDGNAVIMVSGVIFDDKCYEDEVRHEEERIIAYYVAVCESYSTKEIQLSYPSSLHFNGNNGREVAAFKRGVQETIKEFMESGTFKGATLFAAGGMEIPKRRGIFYPYVFLKSDNEKEQFCNKEFDYIYEKTASNLYYHMVKDILTRVICQFSRKRDDRKYLLHIATRSTPLFFTTDTRKENYENAGYDIISTKKDSKPLSVVDISGTEKAAFRVQLTNKDVYRTIVREIISKYEVFDADIQMNVKSTNYQKIDRTNAFLYLADSMCSLLSYRLEGTTANEWFEAVLKRADKIVNLSRFYAFGYDPIDDCYSKAYDAMLRNDIYDMYVNMYEGTIKKGAIAEYYKNYWFTKLEKEMQKKISAYDIEQTILRIEHTQKSNAYQINCSRYILDHTIVLCEKKLEKEEKYIPGNVLFRLYNISVTAYSHMGDTRLAKDAYRKAMRYSKYITAEEFLRLKSKMANIFCDSFEFEDARRISEEIFALQEKIAEFKSNIIEILPQEGYLERNKALSQIAQVYAFMRKSIAEEKFKEALVNMRNRKADYYITLSYLLHFYLDNKMEEKYKERAKEYFIHDDLEGQFEYIASESKKKNPVINPSYALYLYLKSLWIFHRDSISNELLEKLKNIKNYIFRENKKIKFEGHPNELVLKYLMLIMLYNNEKKAYKKYEKEYERSYEGQGDLVRFIGMYGNIQLKEFVNDSTVYFDMLILAKQMSTAIEFFKNSYFSKSKEDLEIQFEQIFVYMYV
ncbi:MAG: hypothetical protein IJZ00_05670 [Lachnospiraceae bacterium]|nr:hypothetical protein [Lachnospiraceae bacterium]